MSVKTILNNYRKHPQIVCEILNTAKNTSTIYREEVIEYLEQLPPLRSQSPRHSAGQLFLKSLLQTGISMAVLYGLGEITDSQMAPQSFVFFSPIVFAVQYNVNVGSAAMKMSRKSQLLSRYKSQRDDAQRNQTTRSRLEKTLSD